jgi:ABC-type transporter MlaC component
MKTIVLLTALLFATQAYATPEQSVSDTISKLLAAVDGGNDQTKISKLCSLAKSELDTGTIGNDLLGGFFSKLQRDADGISKFKKLVPSIVVDQFYDLLNNKGGKEFTIKGRVAKGSSRIGVLVQIGNARFTITVLKSNEKVVDVEYQGFSLVKNKSRDLQGDLQAFYSRNRETSLPVSDLVAKLTSRGITKCGTR